MRSDPPVSHERLRRLVKYDKETGLFERLHMRRQDGKCGALTANGYIRIRIDGRKVMAHRLAWFYHYGEWPQRGIDHINGAKTDNRISNLRLATDRQNQGNRKMSKSCKSGIKGVCWSPVARQWRAQITVDRKVINLGYFRELSEAGNAYRQAAEKYHGEYASHLSREAGHG